VNKHDDCKRAERCSARLFTRRGRAGESDAASPLGVTAAPPRISGRRILSRFSESLASGDMICYFRLRRG